MPSDEITIKFTRHHSEFEVEACWRDYRIGEATGTRRGKRMKINDLRVSDRQHNPYPILHVQLTQLFGARTRNFRHQGIGSKLLNRLLAEARAAGVTRCPAFGGKR